MDDLDKTVQELFTQLRERKKKVDSLKEATKESWRTNCVFKVPFTDTQINIQTLPREKISLAVGTVKMYNDARNEGIDLQKTGEPKDYIDGEPFWNWVWDCNKRLAIIQLKDEETKLKDLESRLNKVLSPEAIRKMEIEAIAKELLK